MQQLVLASGSKYRQQRLIDAGISFIAHPANIDEKPLIDETPKALVRRLAFEKARHVQSDHPGSIIIGSDQIAVVETESGLKILGKAGSFENAKEQIALCNGKTVSFLTSLCLLAPSEQAFRTIETVNVVFKSLSEKEIENYLRVDQPYDCAGSFKMEKAGIFLFERIESRDPNALIGLPMIALAEGLSELGHSVFDFMT
jgi:MAF protein